MKITIDPKDLHNKHHVFIFDEQNNLRLKFWFHGHGWVLWRKFDKEGRTIDAGSINALEADEIE